MNYARGRHKVWFYKFVLLFQTYASNIKNCIIRFLMTTWSTEDGKVIFLRRLRPRWASNSLRIHDKIGRKPILRMLMKKRLRRWMLFVAFLKCTRYYTLSKWICNYIGRYLIQFKNNIPVLSYPRYALRVAGMCSRNNIPTCVRRLSLPRERFSRSARTRGTRYHT